jgi:hypothetical protein
MGRMGWSPRMDRASPLLGNEVRPLKIKPRANMTVDSNQIDASADSPEQGRRESGDGSIVTLPTLLFQNGLPDLPHSLIEPHRNRAGVWRIKFSYEAAEPLSMDVVQATTMASSLRELGETELADEVSSAITSAKRYATM